MFLRKGRWAELYVLVVDRLCQAHDAVGQGVRPAWDTFIYEPFRTWLVEVGHDMSCRQWLEGRPDAVNPLYPGTPAHRWGLQSRCLLTDVRQQLRRRQMHEVRNTLPVTMCAVARSWSAAFRVLLEDFLPSCRAMPDVDLVQAHLGPDQAPEDGLPDFLACDGATLCPKGQPPVPSHLPPGDGRVCEPRPGEVVFFFDDPFPDEGC